MRERSGCSPRPDGPADRLCLRHGTGLPGALLQPFDAHVAELPTAQRGRWRGAPRHCRPTPRQASPSFATPRHASPRAPPAPPRARLPHPHAYRTPTATHYRTPRARRERPRARRRPWPTSGAESRAHRRWARGVSSSMRRPGCTSPTRSRWRTLPIFGSVRAAPRRADGARRAARGAGDGTGR